VGVRNPDLKLARDRGLNKARASAAAKATLSMQNSKSWTKTRRSSENNLSTAVARSTGAGTTKKQRSKDNTYGNS
jgi:hypothetical protein